MRKLGSFVVLVGWLAAAPLAFAVECPDGKNEVVIVNIHVGDSITVTPESVEIWLETASHPAGSPTRVCWKVTGLPDGRTLHMGAKNPGPGLFSRKKYSIESKNPKRATSTGTPRHDGNWGYSVWVTLTDDPESLMMVDPVIIINEGITGGGKS